MKIHKQLLLIIILLFSNYVGNAQERHSFIIIDQFGYLPEAPKVAILKDPQTGFDSWRSFTPGNNYAVVEVSTGDIVFTGSPVQWNNGSTDVSSGDRVWWFDFSEVSATGNYYVLDVDKDLRSYEFRISPSVYNEVLNHAVRTFYYQRAGHSKAEPFAEPGWVDAASHIGPGQDKNARLYNDVNNPATERDLSGGWYDAGDYNKYTNWNANYVVEMMLAYLENPDVWTDDYGIPESGNGIPDLLDEAKWGIDHLIRMQEENGSVLSIVGLSHASPPSAATGPSRYGPANTSATLNTAAAFAIASKVYESIGMTEYADTLKQRAIMAWQWADENPNVLFYNNSSAHGTQGLGAGQQEVDDYGRLTAKIRAACFLYEITGEEVYRDYFDNHYEQVNMFQWNFAFPFQSHNQDMVLYYTTIENATPTVADHIRQVYTNAMTNGEDNFPSYYNQTDPYRAHIKDYTWGSNNTKSRKGNMFLNMITHNLSPDLENDARNAAVGYVNYIHGVNPLNFSYLSNMYKYGAKFGVNAFYHTWFHHGSPLWDRAGVSVYGPAPGFLTGGPNPHYNWDNCCPNNCGSAHNNNLCHSENITPPLNQPDQKSYKDFNSSWPLNSWEVTENSNGYQLSYIRLLSHFVNPEYDCNGDLHGTAYIDICGTCVEGNTGLLPETNPDNCNIPYLHVNEAILSPFKIYPNPASEKITISSLWERAYHVRVMDINGRSHLEMYAEGNKNINISHLPTGVYMILFTNDLGIYTHKLIKR